MRLRTRVLASLLGVLAVTTAALLWRAGRDYEASARERARTELERLARLEAAAIGVRPFTDSLADRLGAAANVRLTLIANDGTVRGDSEVEGTDLGALGNHADRPEVAAALRGQVGTAERTGRSRSGRVLYVAVPHGGGVVRVSVALTAIGSQLAMARRRLLATALAVALLILALGGTLSRVVGGTLAPIVRTVNSLTAGDMSARTGLFGPGRVETLGHGVDAMATALGERLEHCDRETRDLEAVLAALDDGIAVINAEGIVVRDNPRFEEAIGRRALVGRPAANLIRDPEGARIIGASRTGEAGGCEIAIGRRTFFLSAVPYSAGALLILRDLTRLRRLERMRRDFVANVSHELKTPLASLRGFAETLAEENIPEGDRRAFAERIVANARRMQALVDDLLDLSRIESGAWRVHPRSIEVAEVAAQVWASLAPVPEESGVGLELGWERSDSSDTLGHVWADPEALDQILSNLFDNALRYAPAGSSVRLSARPAGKNRIRLEVTDSGPGIPAAHRSRVFERFYRVDAARSRAAGGTGLGLSIVRHLVAAHGGEAGIESELGAGTTAWFTLSRSG